MWYAITFLKMWYGKTQITSYELKVQKHKLKFKSSSSNPRVKVSNLRVTSSNLLVRSWNPWVASSKPRVTSWNTRVKSSNPSVTSSNPPIIKSMKTQVNSPQSTSYPKIISQNYLAIREVTRTCSFWLQSLILRFHYSIFTASAGSWVSKH